MLLCRKCIGNDVLAAASSKNINIDELFDAKKCDKCKKSAPSANVSLVVMSIQFGKIFKGVSSDAIIKEI